MQYELKVLRSLRISQQAENLCHYTSWRRTNDYIATQQVDKDNIINGTNLVILGSLLLFFAFAAVRTAVLLAGLGEGDGEKSNGEEDSELVHRVL